MALPEKYLIMVNPDRNNNKFYRLVDNGNGTCTAYWGRIGDKPGSSEFSVSFKTYDISAYFRKLQEKLNKGYKDVSDLHVVKTLTVEKQSGYIPLDNAEVQELMDYLLSCSRKTLNEHYSVSPDSVTQELVWKARATIKAMCNAASDNDLYRFNDELIENFHVLPRKMGCVQSYLARTPDDFSKIIDREQKLLDVMEGYVKANSVKTVEIDGKENSKGMTILDSLGIEIELASDEDTQNVRRHINDSLKSKIKRVFRVKNHKTRKNFEKFVKKHDNCETKMFWHGSTNQNWISIMEKGLLLNPDAPITGKMFGDGIYFAPSAKKSWGYTSAHGSRWAGGNSDVAFMAVFNTAFGSPYVVYDWSSDFHGFNYRRLQRKQKGAGCVFASKEKGMLHEDEVIFYREDQVDIRFLVEFEA